MDTIEIYGIGTVERVLHTLLTQDIPRSRKGAIGTYSAEEGIPPRPEQVNCGLNYGDHNRPFVGGQNYAELTLVRLLSFRSFIHIYYMLGHRNIL